MPFRIITDYDIQALIDGELSSDDKEKVRAFVETNYRAHRRYHELSKQKALLKDWHNEMAETGLMDKA